VPNNELFYLLLNKSADSLSSEEISQLSAFDNKSDLHHDILWLLREGVVRTINNMGDTGQDYFLNALFLIAHFEISELSATLLHLLTGLPNDLTDKFIGDFGDLIIIPSFRKIGLSSLDGFFEMLVHTTKDEYEQDDDDDYE
jgi:hypothetical protein